MKLYLATAIVSWAMFLATAVMGYHMWCAYKGKSYEPPAWFEHIVMLSISSGLVGLGAPGVKKLGSAMHRRALEKKEQREQD